MEYSVIMSKGFELCFTVGGGVGGDAGSTAVEIMVLISWHVESRKSGISISIPENPVRHKISCHSAAEMHGLQRRWFSSPLGSVP